MKNERKISKHIFKAKHGAAIASRFFAFAFAPFRVAAQAAAAFFKSCSLSIVEPGRRDRRGARLFILAPDGTRAPV